MDHLELQDPEDLLDQQVNQVALVMGDPQDPEGQQDQLVLLAFQVDKVEQGALDQQDLEDFQDHQVLLEELVGLVL